MHASFLTSILVATAFAQGCGSAGFGSSSKKAAPTQAASSNTQDTPKTANGETQILTPDQKVDMDAINSCLASWKSHPFGSVTLDKFRRISAAVTVLGAGYAVNDQEKTQTPALILIDASVSVLGSPIYHLGNPNGWYCIKADVNVLSNPTFEVCSTANLADNKVSVNVLSKSDPTAAVGVSVLSKSKLDRQSKHCAN